MGNVVLRGRRTAGSPASDRTRRGPEAEAILRLLDPTRSRVDRVRLVGCGEARCVTFLPESSKVLAVAAREITVSLLSTLHAPSYHRHCGVFIGAQWVCN
jgi:hypothetical protein